ELRSQRLLGLAAMAQDLHLSELVSECLSGPCDVTVDFGRDLVLRQRHGFLHVCERLLTTPAVLMDASVDDQPRRAPDLVRQLAEYLVRRLVDADLSAEPFGVQAPALAVAGE